MQQRLGRLCCGGASLIWCYNHTSMQDYWYNNAQPSGLSGLSFKNMIGGVKMAITFNILLSLLGIACGAALIVRWAVCLTPKKLECGAAEWKSGNKPLAFKELFLVFSAAIGFRILIYVISSAYLSFTGGTPLPEVMVRWDAAHYIGLAQRGYDGYIEDGKHIFLVFFPLYTWILRAFNFIIPNAAAAGMGISSVCYGIGCCFLYALCKKRYSKRTAVMAVVFISVFPFSFFYGGIMTEGLFFMTAAAALYYTSGHRWLLAGVFGALAALTRMNGVLLIAAAGAELFEYYKPLDGRFKINRRNLIEAVKRLPLVFLPIIGTFIYLGLNWYIDGSPFAFVTHQEHWHQGAMWFSQTLAYIAENAFGHMGEPIAACVWIPELLIFIAFFILIVFSMAKKKNPNFILIFAFLSLISNYSLSWLLSAGRYVSAVPAFFILLAAVLEKKKALGLIIACGMFMLLVAYLFGFLSGQQIM